MRLDPILDERDSEAQSSLVDTRTRDPKCIYLAVLRRKHPLLLPIQLGRRIRGQLECFSKEFPKSMKQCSEFLHLQPDVTYSL